MVRACEDAASVLRTLRDWLFTSRGAVLAAFVLSLPALRIGLYVDDFLHRAMLLHERNPMSASAGPFSLFTVLSGEPDAHARALELGGLPWWTDPALRSALFRPVSSLTHAMDYALWPSSPAAMHLHSILWYLLVVVLAAALFRRWLGPLSARAASIATLFYAIDPTHGFPVGWIANRNALITTTFVLAALLFHDVGAKRAAAAKHTGAFPYATALFFALGLCAGEAASAAVFYFAAYALFLDQRPVRARIGSLLPSAIVTLAWAIAYRVGRFGVAGSGVYHDPTRAPLAFLRGTATNAPLLLASELGVTPDGWVVVPFAAKVLILSLALLFLGWAATVLKRAVLAPDERVRRVSRFLIAAGSLSVLPGTATFPTGRLMFIPGLALVGVLAMVCAGALPGPPSRSTRAFAGWCWISHLVIAPVMFVVELHGGAFVNRVLQQLSEGVPADGATADKRLVLVTAPDAPLVGSIMMEAAERGGTPPERVLAMTGNRRDVRFTRTGERTFLVHQHGGFYRTGMELLFRSIRSPLSTGTKITLSDVTVTVTHALPDGVPDEASFELTRNLEDAYVFRKWEGSRLVAFSLPPVGEAVTFPGRSL